MYFMGKTGDMEASRNTWENVRERKDKHIAFIFYPFDPTGRMKQWKIVMFLEDGQGSSENMLLHL